QNKVITFTCISCHYGLLLNSGCDGDCASALDGDRPCVGLTSRCITLVGFEVERASEGCTITIGDLGVPVGIGENSVQEKLLAHALRIDTTCCHGHALQTATRKQLGPAIAVLVGDIHWGVIDSKCGSRQSCHSEIAGR